jgi:hypothetical protein
MTLRHLGTVLAADAGTVVRPTEKLAPKAL